MNHTNTIHSKGYGAPLVLTFALAVFYSGQDATVATVQHAIHAKAGIYRAHATSGAYRPHTKAGTYRPQNTGGRTA